VIFVTNMGAGAGKPLENSGLVVRRASRWRRRRPRPAGIRPDCAPAEDHPTRSGHMAVLVDHSGEPVVSAYVEACDSSGIGDRVGDRA
jgi:hypothetical protein